MTRVAFLLAAAGIVFGLAACSLALAERNAFAGAECTWGASSIVVNESGQVVSGPDVSGCVP